MRKSHGLFSFSQRRRCNFPQAVAIKSSAPTGTRTPVLALRGLRPSPLDDGGKRADFTIAAAYKPCIPHSPQAMERPRLS